MNIIILTIISFVFFILLGLVILLSIYKKVEHGYAIIRTGIGGIKVVFTGIFIIPIFQKYEIVDVRIKKIKIIRDGINNLRFKDDIRAYIKVDFYIKLPENEENIIEALKSLGISRINNIDELSEKFEIKFIEKLREVAASYEFEELYKDIDKFKNKLKEKIGSDLNGYIIENIAFDSFSKE